MSSLGKSFGLSSSLQEEVMMTKKQGIVSILGGFDSERTKSDASLKRTLSADMSSKKWLSQHGFFPLKKIASSDGFQLCSPTDSSSSEEEDYEEGHKEIINNNNKKMEAEKQTGQFDIWSSILSQKAQEDSKNLTPPYVHPLVKRSSSSLSGKSLEICTESLGSETGSDGFSSYPPSETGDAEEDKEEEHHQQQQQEKAAAQKFDMEDWRVAKYKFAATAVGNKRTSPKSFPPPIPSLSSQDGASVHMRSRRDNGRLVLDAVSVASQNNFRAQRQEGRLVLTFINKTNEEEAQEKEQEGPKNEETKEEKNEVDQFELELENYKDEIEFDQEEAEDEEEETEEYVEEMVENEIGGEGAGGGGGDELRFLMELAPKFSSGVIRLAPMMNKSMLLANRNPTWPKSLNKQVKFEELEEEQEEEEEVVGKPITPLTQSLPPGALVARMIPSPPKATVAATAKAAAASLNAYEYYWKPKAMTVPASVLNAPIAQNPASIRNNNNKLIITKNLVANEQQELLVLRGNKGDYLVPFFKGCKKPRRSLLFWEPYCIATS